jgi:hypothetical protein
MPEGTNFGNDTRFRKSWFVFDTSFLRDPLLRLAGTSPRPIL